MKENKILISVYGSLRKNLGNHGLLTNSIYLGEFKTEPVFSLYSLGGFPGLKEGGNTSITMEVYEVTPEQAVRVDALEGYSSRGNNTFYDKIMIDTPYGEAGTYIYVPKVSEDRLVDSGDWKEFKQAQFNYTSLSHN